MPRNGTQSDNVVDTSAGNQVHGVGEDSSIDRSGKVRLAVYTLADQKQCTDMSFPGRPRSLCREGRGH
jgi:cytochrome c-type biogenesis protein CcmE